MPQKLAKPTTAERIMDSAQKLMLKEGYKGVSVDAIIEDAGVSKGTFFYHFSSKDVLANALIERFVIHTGQGLRDLVTQAQSETQGHFAALIYLLENFASVNNKNGGCLLAAFSYQLVSESDIIQGHYQRAIEGWRALFTSFIESAFTEKGIALDSTCDDIATMLFCLMEGGYILERMTNQDALGCQFNALASLLKSMTTENN